MFKELEIQSHRGRYRVDFVSNVSEVLQQTIQPGDFVILDQYLLSLYPFLQDIPTNFPCHLVETSEEAKSYHALAPVIEKIITQGFTKKNRIIAIGGGIIQDIAAFTSSVLFRGVSWVFFPTNLLTQCDSCIGSKTSINFQQYKNQLGTFFPPKQIYISFDFLKTLSRREIQSGLGEMFHYFLVSGRRDFDWATTKVQGAFEQKDEVLGELIHRSLSIKKEMVEIDEFDQHQRNVFNYGHSFGHALESVSHYSIPHGIAVAFGMDLANLLSAKQGLISMEMRNEVRKTLAEIISDVEPPSFAYGDYLAALSKDKKNEGKEIKVILTKGFGEMFKTTLEMNEENEQTIQQFFNDCLWRQDG